VHPRDKQLSCEKSVSSVLETYLQPPTSSSLPLASHQGYSYIFLCSTIQEGSMPKLALLSKISHSRNNAATATRVDMEFLADHAVKMKSDSIWIRDVPPLGSIWRSDCGEVLQQELMICIASQVFFQVT
jgi:hypothetical protein